MKLLVCRKRKKNILTFEYSKSSKNRRNNFRKFKQNRVDFKTYFPVLVVDNLKNRDYNKEH